MTIHERLHQYSLLIRWHRPIGTLLILWPVLAALLIATNGHPPAKLIFIFVVGVFVMRAAGCIVNDIIDIQFDKHVARTQTRPLTAGTIKIWEAMLLLIILLLISLVLVLMLNIYSLVLACIGILLTVIYPFTKRFFSLPQGILGLVFNLGILMAFAASNNYISFTGWLLFFIAVIWTIAYDTMYAIGDREDDLKLGLNSSAIWFGKHDRLIIAFLQVVVLITLIILGLLINANSWYYASIFVVLLSFVYQQWMLIERKPDQCLAAFTNNHWSWFFIFFGVYLNFLH